MSGRCRRRPDETKKGADPAAPPKQVVTKDYFRDPDSWTQDGAWWIHKGDSVSWLNNSQGVFVIQFLRQKSGIMKRTRRVEWVIDQGNSLNRIEYWFDFSNLDRRVIVAGKTESNRVKVPSGAASGESYTIQIEITPDRIVITRYAGQRTGPISETEWRRAVWQVRF